MRSDRLKKRIERLQALDGHVLFFDQMVSSFKCSRSACMNWIYNALKHKLVKCRGKWHSPSVCYTISNQGCEWLAANAGQTTIAELTVPEVETSDPTHTAEALTDIQASYNAFIHPLKLSYEAKIHAMSVYYQESLNQLLADPGLPENYRAFITSVRECAP